jgi:hypothetical protein
VSVQLTLPNTGASLPVSVAWAQAIQDAVYNAYITSHIDHIADPDSGSINFKVIGKGVDSFQRNYKKQYFG